MFKKIPKTAIPIAFGYFVVSFAFGVGCVSVGLPVWFPPLMSALVYAGAAQFAFLALVTHGASVLTIVITTFFINLRHMLMSIYMNNHFKQLKMKKLDKFLYAIGLTDESFAFHALDKEENLKDKNYYLIFNLTCYLSWVLGSFLGALFFSYYGKSLNLNLDFALTAMMIFVLIILIDSKIKVVVAVVSFIIGSILIFISNSHLDIFISTFLAVGVGIWLVRKF